MEGCLRLRRFEVHAHLLERQACSDVHHLRVLGGRLMTLALRLVVVVVEEWLLLRVL